MLLLNLGCGSRPKAGYVNVDIDDELQQVDEIVDLNQLPWPWTEGEVDAISMVDVVHLLAPLGPINGQLNIPAIMSEVHRVLKPGGFVEIVVPGTEGRGAFSDPLAYTFWNLNTFLNFLPGQIAHLGYPKFEIETRGAGVDISQPDGLGDVWIVARLYKPGSDENADDTGSISEPAGGSPEGTGSEPVPGTAGQSGQPEVRE